jgi:hypothetical protein
MFRFGIMLGMALGFGTAATLAQDAAPDSSASDIAQLRRTPTEAERDRAKSLLERAWKSFDEIRTGIYRVSELTALGVTEISPERDQTDQIQYFVAFDHQTGKERFDYRSGARMTSFARNDREALLLVRSQTSESASRHPRDYKVTVHDAQPIDFRAISLSVFATHRNKFSVAKVREILDEVSNETLIVFVENGSQVRFEYEYKMRDQSPASPIRLGRTTFVFDRDHGLMPILLEDCHQSKGGEWAVDSRTETKWRLLADKWVPVQSKLISTQMPGVTELTMDWEIVDRQIPQELFEFEGLGVTPGTLVFQFR